EDLAAFQKSAFETAIESRARGMRTSEKVGDAAGQISAMMPAVEVRHGTQPLPLGHRSAGQRAKGGGRVLVLGVTEPFQGFAPLPGIAEEISSVRAVFARGTTLLKAQFSVTDAKREMKGGDYTIVHVASHGEFGGEVNNTSSALAGIAVKAG